MTRTILLLAGALASLRAEVRLPALIGDHMVLQSGAAARIWGQAGPGEKVSIAFRGRTASTQAGADGKWQAFLPPSEPGGPFTLQVNGIVVKDVVVGEVWVASGQSNMAMKLDRVDNAEREIAAANLPSLRYFQVARRIVSEPQDEVEGEWRVSTPENAPLFSAVAYFFAKFLHEARKVPVGIVESAVGGSPAQAWTPMGKLKADPLLGFYLANWDKTLADGRQAREQYPRTLEKWKQAAAEARKAGKQPGRAPLPPPGPGHQWAPSECSNGMIHPLRRYTIRGALWYQGENNGSRGQGDSYNRLFETMIRSWRELWGQGDFPFLFVQLPNFAKVGEASQWPEVREAQMQTLALRHTAMAVAIDVGNPQDVHPTNKRPVGERLALAARATVYGEKIEWSGPLFRRATAEGGALRLWFDHARGMAGKGGELKGFEIAAADGSFVPARAAAEGETVVVASDSVAAPKRVRYAWGNDPPCNLYNAAGLPASPFRASVE